MEAIKISSVQSETYCPKCHYKHCIYEWSSHGHEWWFCERCGYSCSTDDPEDKNIDPLGSTYYHNKKIGGGGCYTTPEDLKEFIAMIKANISEMVTARYTYCKDGEYYIYDLIEDIEIKWKDWEVLEEL